MLKTSIALTCALFAVATVACGADAPAESAGSSTSNLSGRGCGAGVFESCVHNGGGRACANLCDDSCVDTVASCLGGGGGVSCAKRCSGTVGGGGTPVPACQPQELWTKVGTAECGIPYGWGGHSAATPGEAKATCTKECDGRVDHCTIWHTQTGRADCTIGVPIDNAGNPW